MELNEEEIGKLSSAIREVSKYDFTNYSVKSFSRRIEKILKDYNLTLEQLIVKLYDSNEFLEEIVREITVNTTELFRDPELWITIKNEILPRYKNNEIIRIWHIGMSSGQEVYSMMILLSELGLLDKTEIYGSDLNSIVIEEAGKGLYRFRIIADYLENYNKVFDLSDKRQSKAHYENYFSVDWLKGTIKLKKALTEKPIFKKHDLVSGGNIVDNKFDIIVCRNLLIYFNQDLQNKSFYFFHQILNDNGALILGAHESIMGNMITRFDKRENFYFKKENNLF
jgi:chemotaxis protein methyltransferase CheR